MPEHSPAPTPARGIYGFVLYFSSIIVYGLYILWAYLPLELFNSIGLTYWPQKYWAIAIPVFASLTCMVAYSTYLGINFIITSSLDSITLIKDEHSIYSFVKNEPESSIPSVSDVSVTLVNKILHRNKFSTKSCSDPFIKKFNKPKRIM